jgi:hypothetical protein
LQSSLAGGNSEQVGIADDGGALLPVPPSLAPPRAGDEGVIERYLASS